MSQKTAIKIYLIEAVLKWSFKIIRVTKKIFKNETNEMRICLDLP